MLLALLPFTFFVFQLVDAKLAELPEFGRLASRYTHDFQQQCLRESGLGDEALLGTGDIQSMADLANSCEVVRGMRPAPFGRRALVRLAILIVAPLLPLVLTMIALDQ